MAKIRLVHAQTQRSTLNLTDIDSGLPTEEFPARLLKQQTYVPFHKKSIVGGRIVEDRTVPGFTDLVLSDKVKLSADRGVIAGLVSAGQLTRIDLPDGALAAPVISSATEDTSSSATSAVNNGLVTLAGTGFASYAPDVSTVTLTPTTGAAVTLTATQITTGGGTFTATASTIPAALHGFPTNGTNNIVGVTLTANGQSVTFAVTII
jgi:hypothetical protein